MIVARASEIASGDNASAKGSPPKSALIFQSNDAVGLVVQKMLPEHAKTLGLDVPFSQSFQMGLSDPSVAVAPILRYKPDLIFLGGFTNDIILIIKALRGVGVTAPIFGAGPAGTDSVGKGLGEAVSLCGVDALEGDDRLARHLVEREVAADDGLAVDEHGAAPALPRGRAAILRRRDVELVAQRRQQVRVVGGHRHRLAVHREVDAHP